MKPDTEVKTLTDTLNETRFRMKELATARPEGWKAEYARLRPTFEQQAAKASLATLAWLRKVDPAAADEYQRMVERANAKLAEHQARYPVFVLDGTDPAYVASMREVNANLDEILAYVESKTR